MLQPVLKINGVQKDAKSMSDQGVVLFIIQTPQLNNKLLESHSHLQPVFLLESHSKVSHVSFDLGPGDQTCSKNRWSWGIRTILQNDLKLKQFGLATCLAASQLL